MKEYIISLDQGTTSSRAIIFDRKQNVIAKAQSNFQSIYPQDGWVEQDPMEIWSSQSAVLSEVIAKSGIHPSEIEAIGITNQRETTIIWDRKTGKPIYNAIVWQCRRSASYCEKLIADNHEAMIKEKTGLVVDAYFSATKIQWLLDHVENARERAENGELMFGTVDTWLLYNLSNKQVHSTDMTNASRTMLYNIKALQWDKDLLKLFNIPKSLLPEVKESSAYFGYANIQGYQIPITSMVGDQQAALFGQRCFEQGDVKSTYGTGAFILMNTKEHVLSNHGLLTTIALGHNGQVDYALEGSVFMAGALLDWLKRDLNFFDAIEDSAYFASKVEDTAGVVCVPALSGLGAPYWDMQARGAFLNLTLAANKNHLIRAAIEAIALQTYDVIQAMEEDAQVPIKQLRVDGGVSNNDFLMQFQADILNCHVTRPNFIESTAVGAYYLAGLKTGYFADIAAIKAINEAKTTWEAKLASDLRQAKLKQWHQAVHKIIHKN